MKKIILLLLLSIFLVSACAQKPAETEEIVGQGMPVPGQEKPVTEQEVTQQVPAGDKEAEEMVAVSNSEVKEFKMTAKQFAFVPETIEVNKGDKVRLIVTSTDIPHGIAIPEYGINERLDPGKEVSIEFTADKQGTFTAFCSVFCGSGHSNMKGKIVVR